MTKSLKVIKPLLSLSIGDTLELSEDGKFYVFEYKDHYDESNYMFSTTCSFSTEYANELIKAVKLVSKEKNNLIEKR